MNRDALKPLDIYSYVASSHFTMKLTHKHIKYKNIK